MRKQGASYVGTVVFSESFLGNCHIEAYLSFQSFTQGFKVCFFCKFYNFFNAQYRVVGESVCLRNNLFFTKSFAVFLYAYNVCVVLGKADKSTILTLCEGYHNIKDVGSICKVNGYGSFLQERLCFFYLIFGNV